MSPVEPGDAVEPGGGIDPDSADFVYDEFGMFHENCAEYELELDGQVEVVRVEAAILDGSTISALRWGNGAPAVVFLHGSAQNAHTWDTVALALHPTPALAVDLPGHGHSGWRDDGRYDPHTNAEGVIEFLEDQLDGPVLLVGMSLGGLTATRVAAERPDLVSGIVVVDITPGVTRDKAKEIHDFIAGPQSFASFGEIFDRTVEFNPTRSASSLRRGILHNARRTGDGSWQWVYDRRPPQGESFPTSADMWADLDRVTMPYLLVRGADSPVVDDDDVAEVRRRLPEARVVLVDAAGHSVQGDQPLVLADLLRGELGG